MNDLTSSHSGSKPDPKAKREMSTEHGSTARLAAAHTVRSVLAEQSQIEIALAGQPGFADLDPRDRAFARLIVATTFRRLGQIDLALKPFLRKPPHPLVHAILRTAVAQMLFLKTPPHAAVGEAVDLVKSSPQTDGLAAMTNAVLRRIVEKGQALAAAAPPSQNIPGWIRGAWEREYGKPAMRRMALQLMTDPPLDIHVKDNPQTWAESLEADVLWGQTIRRTTATHVPDLPGFGDGDWWIQDIAATLPVILLGDVAGSEVLDLCAAPGGKTLQLAARGARVTALDKSGPRLERVHENLKRTKLSAEIIEADGIDWARETERTFDHVLIDAPCSATGTFRRHPDVLYNKTPKDVAALVHIQRKMLVAASKLVRPGGRLVFCTCSLQPEEGEKQATEFLTKNGNWELIPPAVNDLPKLPDGAFDNGYMRVLPHFLSAQGGMDGFFAMVMKRLS